MELYASNKLSTMPYSPCITIGGTTVLPILSAVPAPMPALSTISPPPNVFCVCASAVMPATSKAANRMIPLFIPFISMILPSCLFPYLPCGKPPQSKYKSKYINFIRASLLYGREKKLPDGIRLYSPCIVKDWKCEIHSLSLSCYPMGRDILMKVFRFCLVMGI